MSLRKISEHVHILPHDTERDRPNLGYIAGEDYSVLIDTGNSPAHLIEMLDEIEQNGLPTPKLALITHWHWDHTFAMHAFNGLTVAHRQTNEILKEISEWEWTYEAMDERLASGEECEFCDTHIRKEYDDTRTIQVEMADIEFEDGLRLNLGEVHLNVIRLTNPHSDDGVVAHVEEDKVLFAGDADTGDYYKLDGGYDKRQFHDYIGKISLIDFDTYIHGHLEPMSPREIKEEWDRIEKEEALH
ncbi:MBL fold metallo-hydrolase [Salinicoccus albus]|uniref:MBL fold metallo-hydrolase n=1 Tax=Salinicoccus albus TaxID=418756 RepID=UPI000366AAC5|nr:MBL fold metallo-hydrolase [Salinicoccus albus]